MWKNIETGIKYDEAGVRAQYPNQSLLSFTEPYLLSLGYVWEPEPPPPVPRHITRLAFRNRFTQDEKVGLEIAQLDVPTAPMPQRAQAAALRASQADVNASTFIDLDRADTRAGVQALEAAGLLAAGRALQILDAEIQQHERYVP